MRNLTFVAALALLIAVIAGPAQAQQQQMTIEGEAAVKIVQSGKIRASKSEGVAGFVLLMDYQGKTYVCAIAVTGQVQTCDQIYW